MSAADCDRGYFLFTNHIIFGHHTMRDFFFNLSLLTCRITRNPVFIIGYRKGRPPVVKGSVKSSFTSICYEILQQGDIGSGLVFAVKGKYGVPVLKTSGSIPPHMLQQLRNTWGFSN